MSDVRKRFARLEQELDELMKSDAISEMGDKALPYLGWWWRSIGPKVPSVRLSWTDGHWWIDEAGKWSYPSKMIKDEEAIELIEQCIKAVKKGVDSDEYRKLWEMLKKDPPEVKK